MDSYLTTQEIADYLGVNRVTISNWIKDHNFPRQKAGRLNRFKKAAVDEWIAQRTLKADSKAVALKNEHPRLGRRDPRRPVTFSLD